MFRNVNKKNKKYTNLIPKICIKHLLKIKIRQYKIQSIETISIFYKINTITTIDNRNIKKII
jgi:hypothetical protein